MPRPTELYKIFNLAIGEDSYASSTAQDPNTARRLVSLIPSLAGSLSREQRHPAFLASTLTGGAVVFLDEFNWFDSSTKAFSKFFFAATATKLYKQKVGTDADWVEVTAVGTLANIPVARSINNLYHLSDGISSWIFDGTTWSVDGLPIPLSPPFFDSSTVGRLVVTNNRYYWFSFEDQTAIRLHESSVSPISDGIGAVSYKKVKVRQQAGTATATISTTGITRTKDDFLAQHVGMKFYINGLDFGTIASRVAGVKASLVLTMTAQPADGETVTIDGVVYRFKTTMAAINDVARGASIQESAANLYAAINGDFGVGTKYFTGTVVHPNVEATAITQAATSTITVSARYSGTWGNALAVAEALGAGSWAGGGVLLANGTDSTAVLNTAAPSSQAAQLFVIAPVRATHWVIYASEAEASTVGFKLASVAVTTMEYEDESPFTNQAGSLMSDVETPFRNDPPTPTRVMAIHKRRIVRRRETQRNFFNFTGSEEVIAQDAGAAEESTPGVDDNTVSDIVNENSYPDESDEIRAMVSHGALFIGTEDEIIPMYGESYDDFLLSDVAVFRVGMASRTAALSTPFGLVFFSTDRKWYLYPSASAPMPGADATSRLVELSRPQRTRFKDIKDADLLNIWGVHYNWTLRNWLVFCYQDKSSVYHTWVFDWETKGWFEFSTGYASLAVFEIADGSKVLIGGGTDGKVYVVDDLTGTYTGSGNFAVGTFRPALMDFGKPEMDHLIHYVEYEKSDATMEVTVLYWFDPVDVDSPGTGIELPMSETDVGANRYRGFPKNSDGAVCHRLLLEFQVPASTVDAKLTGILVAAQPVDPLGTK